MGYNMLNKNNAGREKMGKFKFRLIFLSVIKFSLLIFVIFILLSGCALSPESPTGSETGYNNKTDNNINMDSACYNQKSGNTGSTDAEGTLVNNKDISQFINSDGTTLDTRILAPEGYTRMQSDADKLTGFIRNLPLKEDGSKVLQYNGKPISNQDNHVAVFDIDTGKKDLQQCADSVIRIYAEYFWSTNEYDKIAFHLTSGFYMEYTKWREGYRIEVNGNDVRWIKSSSYDDSYENFIKYLETVFTYAGTLSLAQECSPVSLNDLRPGDLLLKSGSPGHCVMIVDMARNENGNCCYLLAQGYMPAQDFHVLKNPIHPDDPWYYADEMDFPIKTSSWTFDEGSMMRWADFS